MSVDQTCNDVLKALAPDNRKALDRLKAEIFNQFGGSLGAGKDINAIRTYITGAADAPNPTYASGGTGGQLASARRWVGEIQDRILAATASSVCRSGALVTQEMLDRLCRDEIPFLIAELQHEQSEYVRFSHDLDSEVQNALSGAGSSSISANNPMVSDAVHKAAECLFFQAEAAVRDLAAELLHDLSENFLRPLARHSLSDGAQQLFEDEKPKGAVPSAISQWPHGEDVPKRLKPAPNEFLLEDPEGYPHKLRELVSRSVENREYGDAEGEVVGEILSGAKVVGGHDQQMIEPSRRWSPANPATSICEPAPAARSSESDCVITTYFSGRATGRWTERRSWVGISGSRWPIT